MDFSIIDCHTHVYPDKIAARAVESIGKFYDLPTGLDGTVDTLLRLSREAGISRCLVLGVAVDPLHVKAINDFSIRTVREHPGALWGFATLHPDADAP